MKRLLFVLVWATALFSTFASASSFEAVRKILDKPKTLCGRFDQEKQLQGIKKPLLSHGRFCVQEGGGVIWKVVRPFPNTLIVTRNKISEIQDGRLTDRLDADKEPTVRVVNNLLFSLLSGDFTPLESFFDAAVQAKSPQWQVALKARDAGLAKVIQRIELNGGRHVERIAIDEAGGDKTRIRFSDITAGPSAMTPEEAALLQ